MLVGGAAPADRELTAAVLALAVRTGVATGRLTLAPIPGGDDVLLIAVDGEGVAA